MMNSIPPPDRQYLNLYFQVHQPRRLSRFQFFDIGSSHHYFDDELNREILCRIADECYLPANKMLLHLIRKFPELKVTFSISGIALEQMEQYAPVVIQSFRQLADTASIEFLAETYYHSLAYLISHEEFIEQVNLHGRKIRELFGVSPMIFRNTELIYSDGVGKEIAALGFKGMLIDGIEKILERRTPNALYRHPYENLVLFPRNYQLSDDIAFRYSDRNWAEWPLTGSKFSNWISLIPRDEKFVSLGMDYETFGEHKKARSGIFQFFGEFITQIMRQHKFTFITPSEAIKRIPTADVVSTDRIISWADRDRDMSAWLGNEMQRDAFDSLYKFHDAILDSADPELINTYRNLQTSDHFYYMSTKKDEDGSVHQYFSPYRSPYEAFMNFMNIIADLELQVNAFKQRRVSSKLTEKDRKSNAKTRLQRID